MAGLKEQLEAAGYDTAGMDEGTILSQLDKAGYDVSQFKQTPLEMSKDWEGPGLQDVSMTPITKPDLEQAGEDIATSKFGQQHPILGAAAGTAVAKADDIALAASGLNGLRAAEGAVKAGTAGPLTRILAGPGRAEAGQAIGRAEAQAGINVSRVPTLKDAATNLGAWKANPQQYLNALSERLIQGGDLPLNAQELSLHHKMLTDLLSQEPGKLAQTIGLSKSNLGTNAVATATQLDRMIVQQLNNIAPGRAEAAANYAAAMTRNKIYKGAAGLGAAAAGKNILMEAYNRVAGRR